MNGRNLLPRFLMGAIALSFVSGPAWAAPRYERKHKLQHINVKRTDATRGILEEKARRDRNHKVKKPQPSYTPDLLIKIQGKVQYIRNQQIQNFEQLIQETDDSNPEKPDLWFRLAELFAKKQRYWQFRAGELYTALDKARTQGQKNAIRAKQARYRQASKRALLNAIKVYAQITNNPKYRKYPRMDEVLFYYAYMLTSAKRPALARAIYKRLIENYSGSKYIPQAYLAFADNFFNNNDMPHALQFYDKVLEFKHASIYAYALYKKGWVFLNMKREKDALATFFKVVEITRHKKRKKVLNRAAKKDFVRAYAAVGKPQLAYHAFQRVDRSYAFKMLQILAGMYLDQGAGKKAIFVYRQMISLRPRHPKVCEWQYNVVRAMLSVGQKPQQAAEIKRLDELYAAYRRRHILKGNNLSECRENAMATTGQLAKIWHNEAIKTLNPDTLQYAEKLYRAYIKSFPHAKDIGAMRYYLADLLWSRAENEQRPRLATERWEDAAVAFTDAVKAGGMTKAQTKDAAYAAVLGWKNALQVDPRAMAAAPPPKNADKNAIPKPRPIPPRKQKMLAAFDLYIKYVHNPGDKELVGMEFLKAHTYWEYDHLAKADKMFEDIIQNHPEHETALYSAQALLDSLIRLHKYHELRHWVGVLLANKKFLQGKDALRARLERLKIQSLRKDAEQLEKKGKYVQCGLAYQTIYNHDPDAPKAKEVLYNGGVCFEEAKSIGLAIRMFSLLSKRFPKSHLAQKAIVRLGNNYAAIAYYGRAASRYEQYAKKFAGEKDAPKALNNAVFYRRGLGDDDQAIKDTKYFIKEYKRKRRDEAASAMFSIAAIYEKRGEKDMEVKQLKNYLHTWGRRGGVDRELIAHAKIGQILWQESCPVRGVENKEGIDGACVKIQRERATLRRRHHHHHHHHGLEEPHQCGPKSKIKLTVITRGRRRAREAQQNFREAERLWAGGRLLHHIHEKDASKLNIRKAKAVYWYAASRFYRNEVNYENFLSLRFPKHLDFDPRHKRKAKKSLKRFLKWYKKKNKLGTKTAKEYRSIVDIHGGGAAWAIAAAARIGQISQDFADALFTAQIPTNVRTGKFADDKVQAYCDALTTKAQPLEDLSVKAFGFCLTTSTHLNWFNRWSKLCEHELGQIRPEEYPQSSELWAAPDEVAAITDSQGLVSKIKLK